VLLTTHYLEEAEALCGRIAMLKQGRVVALDRTTALLAGTASTMLQFKLDKPLPPALAANARVTGRIVQLKAHDAREVESILAVLHAPAASPRTWRSAAPTSRTCSSRSCAARRRRGWPHERGERRSARLRPRPASSPAPARCSTRRCCASGR
jgi:ABC-type glutathione transport system ATPase component